MTLLELFQLMRKHLKPVIILPLTFALFTALFSFVVLPNEYTATVSCYVLSGQNEQGNSVTNTYSELNASQMLANDVATLAKSSAVKEKAAASLGLASLEDYTISVTSSTTTRVISIQVESTNQGSCAQVANQIAKELSGIAKTTMGIDSVNIVDAAKTPTSPSGPPRLLYTLVAFLVGLFVAIAIVVILDMIDTKIRNIEEVADTFDLPVLGRIPLIH